MVDTRYNPQSAMPEWKEQGADTWHPFNREAICGSAVSTTQSVHSASTYSVDVSGREKLKYRAFFGSCTNNRTTTMTITKDGQQIKSDSSAQAFDWEHFKPFINNSSNWQEIDVSNSSEVVFSFIATGDWGGYYLDYIVQ